MSIILPGCVSRSSTSGLITVDAIHTPCGGCGGRKKQGLETWAGSWPEEFRKGAPKQCFQQNTAFCLPFDYSTFGRVKLGADFGAKRGINRLRKGLWRGGGRAGFSGVLRYEQNTEIPDFDFAQVQSGG
jgi:hypothetical protein